MWGTGMNPRSATAFAAATRMSRSSFPRNVTLIFVPGGIADAASSRAATSFPVISSEKSLISFRAASGSAAGLCRDTDRGPFRCAAGRVIAPSRGLYLYT